MHQLEDHHGWWANLIPYKVDEKINDFFLSSLQSNDQWFSFSFAESFVFDGGPPSFLHSNQIADKNLSALSRHFCFLLNPVSNGTGGELDI